MVVWRKGDSFGGIEIEGNTFEHVEKFMALESMITRKTESKRKLRLS